MNATIEGLLTQMTAVDQDCPGVFGSLRADQFNWSPGSGRWSAGQCLEHLSITTERYLPVLDAAMTAARQAGWLSSGPFVLGLVERVFLKQLEPPVGWKVRTPAAFVGAPQLPQEATLARWEGLQAQMRARIETADGLDLSRVKVKSQFGPVSFSLYGTFIILLAHQRRHLWQAREVRRQPGFPA